ncbi:hypothetical protein ACJZ2D_007307 [Fusarium nematophilum]
MMTPINSVIIVGKVSAETRSWTTTPQPTRRSTAEIQLRLDLADRAIDKWKQWNKDSGQELFSNSGWARLTDIGRPQDVDLETYETMKKAGLGQTQYSLHSEEDLKRAEGDGENLPELVGAEMAAVKMCWYADAPDLEFVVDRIPGADLVVTGGSFHGKAQILAGPG